MSKAEEFLNWWIRNNVVSVPADAAETVAWANRLVERFTKAATQFGIDLENSGLDHDRLYERMIDAIRIAKSKPV